MGAFPKKMKRISPIIVVGLVFCLLVVGGFFTAQAVAHSQEHSQHHHQGAHATLLCSWFCAAGHSLDTASTFLNGPVESYLKIDQWHSVVRQPILAVPSFSRGPPSW